MPRLRGLLHPERGAERVPAARHSPREVRGGFRDRLLEPLPVLHEHLRLPHHPRARAGGGDRGEDRQPRPERLGGDRRRRRALHRRQPSHPRSAAQRGAQDSHVQQPHLWADQGAVLAHVRAGEAYEVHPVRFVGPASAAPEPGSGRRSHLRGPLGGRLPEAFDGCAQGGGGPRGNRVRRDLPELQHLQRRRIREPHREGRATGDEHRTRAGPAHPVRQGSKPRSSLDGEPVRNRRPGRRRERIGFRRARHAQPRSHSGVRAEPAGVARVPGADRCLPRRPGAGARVGDVGSSAQGARSEGRGDLEALLNAGDTWEVKR